MIREEKLKELAAFDDTLYGQIARECLRLRELIGRTSDMLAYEHRLEADNRKLRDENREMKQFLQFWMAWNPTAETAMDALKFYANIAELDQGEWARRALAAMQEKVR